MSAIKAIPILPERRKKPQEKASEAEMTHFRSLSGAMIWAGSGALPQAAYVGSDLQQRIPNLKVHDLCEANGMLKEMRDLKPILYFPRPVGLITSSSVLSFSDTAFNISKKNQYGQTGILTGLDICSDNGDRVYHLVDWASTKQKRSVTTRTGRRY